MPVAFQVIIGKLFLRPPQTCFRTCGYLFTTGIRKMESCLPPIIDFRLRDAQTCGCTRNFLFATLQRAVFPVIIGLRLRPTQTCTLDP